MYDGVIFDKDGVLLDSGLNNFRWADRVRIKEAEKNGYNFSINDARLVAKGSEDDLNKLLEEKDLTFEGLMEIERGVQKAKIRMIKQGYIRLFPEARKVVRQVDTAGLATNASKLATDFTLDFFGLENEFDTVESVKLEKGCFFGRRKPKPDMLNDLIDVLGLDNPVMVGDSSSDVLAAENARIDSILIESYRKSNGLDPTHRVKTISEALGILQ